MEPVDATVPYKLGQMDARMGNMESDISSIKADVKILLARDAQQQGSKTTMAGVGVGGVSVGGLIVAALQLWAGDHQPAQQQQPPAAIVQPAPRDYSDRRVSEPTGP